MDFYLWMATQANKVWEMLKNRNNWPCIFIDAWVSILLKNEKKYKKNYLNWNERIVMWILIKYVYGNILRIAFKNALNFLLFECIKCECVW